MIYVAKSADTALHCDNCFKYCLYLGHVKNILWLSDTAAPSKFPPPGRFLLATNKKIAAAQNKILKNYPLILHKLSENHSSIFLTWPYQDIFTVQITFKDTYKNHH